jgi:hypothetical protein
LDQWREASLSAVPHASVVRQPSRFQPHVCSAGASVPCRRDFNSTNSIASFCLHSFFTVHSAIEVDTFTSAPATYPTSSIPCPCDPTTEAEKDGRDPNPLDAATSARAAGTIEHPRRGLSIMAAQLSMGALQQPRSSRLGSRRSYTQRESPAYSHIWTIHLSPLHRTGYIVGERDYTET